MTYEESFALMTDAEFRGRIQVSAIKYADSIMIEATTVPAHNTRLRWAQSTFQNPVTTAQVIQSPVVMDPAVQAEGAEIADLALQGAVQAVVDKML